MPEIDLCECEHFEDEHFAGVCHQCEYHWNKYGEMKHRKVSLCQKYNKKYTVEVGKIDSAKLFIGERGGLQMSICFDFGGHHQCFGGYGLGGSKSMTSKPVIYSMLRFFDVDEMKKIVGKYAYAVREGSMIHGIKRIEFDSKDRHDNISVWSYKYFFGDK